MPCVGLGVFLRRIVLPPEKLSSVWGEPHTGGYLGKYSTYRWHNTEQAARLVYDNVGTYSRLGLREIFGSQIMRSNQYKGSGGYAPFATLLGLLTIPAGWYALNGRMGAWFSRDNVWQGILVL